MLKRKIKIEFDGLEFRIVKQTHRNKGLSHEGKIFGRNQVGFDTDNSRSGLLCSLP